MSKWNVIKNFVTRGKAAPEKPPTDSSPKKFPDKNKEIELEMPDESPSTFSKMKSTLTTALIAPKTEDSGIGTGAREKAQMSERFSRNVHFIVVLVSAGCFFMILAYVYFSLVMVVPHKFSLCFALGGICFLTSIALVRQVKRFFKSLFEGEMLLWVILYGTCVFATNVAALSLQNGGLAYFFAIGQIASLSWIVAVSVPGGKVLVRAITNAIKKCCSYISALLFG